MEKRLGVLFVVLSGVGFGFLGIFGRLAFNNGLSVGELLSYRFLLASGLLWLYLLIFNRQLIYLPRKQILISLALGSFGYAIFSTLYFKSIEGISVPLAALLLFTFPIFVNLGAYFFLKRPLSKVQIQSLIISSLGLILLVWGPIQVESVTSIFYALTAAITYSIYVLVSGELQKETNPLSSSLYVISAAALALIIFHQPSVTRITSLDFNIFWIILGIAVISTIAPIILFLSGLQKLNSGQAAVIVTIEPVIATLAAWVLLNEGLSPMQALGAFFVILGMILSSKN